MIDNNKIITINNACVGSDNSATNHIDDDPDNDSDANAITDFFKTEGAETEQQNLEEPQDDLEAVAIPNSSDRKRLEKELKSLEQREANAIEKAERYFTKHPDLENHMKFIRLVCIKDSKDKNPYSVTEAEQLFFQRSLYGPRNSDGVVNKLMSLQFAYFYILPKIHKPGIEKPTRPVESGICFTIRFGGGFDLRKLSVSNSTGFEMKSFLIENTIAS